MLLLPNPDLQVTPHNSTFVDHVANFKNTDFTSKACASFRKWFSILEVISPLSNSPLYKMAVRFNSNQQGLSELLYCEL